jgi:hypothetical protein
MHDQPPKDLAAITASLVFAGLVVVFLILGAVLALAF